MNQPALQGERLTLQYVPLREAVRWDDNPKRHDLAGLAASIRRYGFVDPPKFDAQLSALVYGNGRTHALEQMHEAGEEPPRGILVDGEGRWHVPVAFGLDQQSQAAAQALAVDHNNLTLLGGAFTGEDLARLYDSEGYACLLEQIHAEQTLPVTVAEDDLTRLLAEAGTAGEAFAYPDSDKVFPDRYGVIVLCRDEAHQRAVYDTLTSAGHSCRVVVT